MATSKNVIPAKALHHMVFRAKAGIHKILTLLDSRLRGSDKLVIVRGSHMFSALLIFTICNLQYTVCDGSNDE